MNTLPGKFKLLIKILILALLAGCTKIELWISPERDSTSPGPFTLTIRDVTDRSATLKWTNSTDFGGDSVKYEIAINDSVIAFGLKTTSYHISCLTPDRQYIVLVSAVDNWRNLYQVKDEFKTMESYFVNTIRFAWNYSEIIFMKAVKTADNGVLMGGNFLESNSRGGYQNFILKLDHYGILKWFHSFSLLEDINDVVECRDEGCLVIFKNTVSRLSSSGDEIWSYVNSDTYVLSEIKCAAESANGNFVLAGISSSTWGTDISLQYTLINLSSAGSELWHKSGGTSLISRPRDIALSGDGNILVFGSADYLSTTFNNISSAKECFWILRADANGNFLNQAFYPNAFSDEDVPCSVIVDSEHNYLLSGTSLGLMPPNYSSRDQLPRFIKVRADGTVLWDKYLNLKTSTGYTPSVKDIYQIDGNRYFVLACGHGSPVISILNSAGEIEQSIIADVYPDPMTAFADNQGNYHCIMNESIIILNPKGYNGNHK